MTGIEENDQTQNMASPAVIVAAIRSGGTFLAHCLSNHPEVFCARGEPLHDRSEWYAAMRPARHVLLAALLNQTGYRVSMCKLTYGQALDGQVWMWLAGRQPRVVWLRRENVVRQAVSVLINMAARQGTLQRPQHTFEATGPVQVAFPAETILKVARGLQAQDQRIGRELGRFGQVLRLTYAQVTGGEREWADGMPRETCSRLCAFLGVQLVMLRCDLKRVNPQPLREMLSNWPEVEAAVHDSQFAGCLADE